ncbi:hypothetical protein FI667_g9932, partial [Globisporangium splendens]
MSISEHHDLIADDSFVLEESEIDPVNPTQAISSLSGDTFALLTEVFSALYAQHPLRVAKEASRRERKENPSGAAATNTKWVKRLDLQVEMGTNCKWVHRVRDEPIELQRL